MGIAMSNVSMLPRVPQTGDVIGAYLPTHYNKGTPGPDLRLCVVLGLEVSEDDNTLQGLWMVRLSERTHLVRQWDYFLPQAEMNAWGDKTLQRDYVIRTPRIDLLPATHEYVGSMPVFGHIKSSAWDGLLQQMREGQRSHFCENTYGPRVQLPGTVVKTSMDDPDHFASFDYESIIDSVALPSLHSNHCIITGDEYGHALKQQNIQERSIRQLIHEDFKMAHIGGPDDFDHYLRTVLAKRVMAIRSGDKAALVPAPV